MLKRINALLIIFALAGCTIAGTSKDGSMDIIERSNIAEGNFGDATNFRVGMLLPLSGPAAKQGQGLRNAALMALEDVKNPNMMLQFYDTRSSASGARVAIENAINQKSQLIIGPLTAEEVRAISDKTTRKNIPVVTFSTSNDVLEPGVYSLGLLIGEQVDRMISYATIKHRRNFALLVPDNNTGIAVSKAAIISARKNNVTITSIAFYPPNTSDFSEALKGLTNYEKRSARVKNIRNSLTVKADRGDKNAAKILTRLKNIDTLGDVDFDAIIIPEHGTKLKSAAAMLGYYDVTAPKVKIIGTSIWENSKLNNEGNIIGGWYPVLSRKHNSYFINKYNKIFNETPNSIYAFGYDAVALASTLANNKEFRSLDDIITNPDGYIGINGAFKIYSNGTNQHSLDILEVKREGDVIIDVAPKGFSLDGNRGMDLREIVIDRDYVAPKIYGKDKALAQSLIYGQQLPYYEMTTYQNPEFESEEEVIRKALTKHKIVIP